MPFDFDEIIDRRGTAAVKWDKYAEPDVIPMWVADMDFRSPPSVVDAVRQRVEHGVFGYTDCPPELINCEGSTCGGAKAPGDNTIDYGNCGCKPSSSGSGAIILH